MEEPTLEQRVSMLEIQNQKLIELVQRLSNRITSLEVQHRRF